MTKATALLLGTLLWLAPAQFRSRVDVISVDALVTVGGRPVAGLTAADFEVRDNGVLQQVRLADGAASRLDVILVLDTSASLTPERQKQLRAASETLLEQLRPDDRAALVTFDHAVARRQNLTSDFSRVQQTLLGGLAGGRTSLVDAMYTGLVMAEAGDRRALLIALSDGLDTSSWLEPAVVVDVAKQQAVVAYGVSTAGSATPPVLVAIASATGGDVIDARSRTIEQAFTDVLNEFRRRYLLTFSPERDPDSGWHTLDVRVKRRGATVKARNGYFVRPKS
jgi:VWFA-related protein